MLDPHSVLHALSSREPVALEQLTNERGVYALFDHTGQIRYLGVTAAIKSGFRDRIYHRHITGSKGRSHKFSHAHNIGRMWRSRAGSSSQECLDAKLTKKLRNVFCRRYCKVTYYTVPVLGVELDYFSEITMLESSILSIAPQSMKRWKGLDFTVEDEPKEMVNAPIDELGYSSDLRRALERQAELFARSMCL